MWILQRGRPALYDPIGEKYKMKILHVFGLFSLSHGGGTVDLIYKLARAQIRRGHEVTIYTSNHALDQKYVDSLEGVNIYPFRSIVNMPGFYFTPKLIPEVKRNLKIFDIIHLHSQRCFQNIVIHYYSHKYGIPYIIDAHGSTPYTKKASLKKLFDIFFGNKIIRDCSRFIAESEIGVNEYKELGIEQDKIALIPPPFPVEDFVNLPEQGFFRRNYNIKQKHIIMFLGRIHWIKGIDFLVKSFYELTKRRDDTILVIVGPDDGYLKDLNNIIKKLDIKNRVLFTGFLEGMEKLSALVDASLVIQTSRYEQGAWAPFEAVLCGTPIVVTEHTGAGEDVRRLDAGYLVPFDDTHKLAGIMNQILEYPTEAKNKANKAAAYIRENMSMNTRIEDYENLYADCINAKNAGLSQ